MAVYNSSAAVAPSISVGENSHTLTPNTTVIGSSLHKTFVIGGVIAGVLLVILFPTIIILITVVLCVRRRHGNSSNKSADADNDENLYVLDDYLKLHSNSHATLYKFPKATNALFSQIC